MITTGQRRRSGWGGGQNICFAAFFALFHGLLCRFSDMKRFLNGEGSDRRGHLRRSAASADPESRKPKLWEDSRTTQDRSGLEFLFIFSQVTNQFIAFFPLKCQINWSVTCRLLQVINQLSSTFPPDPCGRSYTRM